MTCTFAKVSIPDFEHLLAIKTSTGNYFFCDKHSFQILTGLEKVSAQTALSRYYSKHYEGRDFPSVLTNPPDSAHVCTFIKQENGKVCRAFSLSGLEYLCNNVTGSTAAENKPKFLELIRTFRSSISADQPAQMIAVMNSLPLALSQAIAGPLQALVARHAETFHEQVKEMAKTMAEKDLECEKVKHTAEMQVERTKYENEAKIKEMEKTHQIELERSKHSVERAQWELKAAEIRQAQRDGQETVKPEIFKPVELPPSQHANLRANAACLWLAMYDAEQKKDAIDFNQINTFAKACSSVMIDRENDTWVGLIELERPMVFADLANEMKLLAQKVVFVFRAFSLLLICFQTGRLQWTSLAGVPRGSSGPPQFSTGESSGRRKRRLLQQREQEGHRHLHFSFVAHQIRFQLDVVSVFSRFCLKISSI